LVLSEQSIRDSAQTEFAHCVIERQLFRGLEVEKRIVQVEKEESVFHRVGATINGKGMDRSAVRKET
jgi:hypothetical protein